MARQRTGNSGVQLGEDVVRAMVLQGAAKALAARGVRPTGIEDILRASRISRRTFYRVYGSKEDVLLALYEIGTERLLDACRRALEQETDPFRMLGRCVDAHMQTAREQSRLMFVLSGEAQNHESLLHARRVAVHEQLAAMMASRTRTVLPQADEMTFRALIFALEGVTRLALKEGNEGRAVAPESLERARTVMLRIATAVIASAGIGVMPKAALEGEALPGGASRRATRR